MSPGKLTIAGLLAATSGWGFLLSYPMFAGSGKTPMPALQIQAGDQFVLTLAQNVILTGFAIALIGALMKMAEALPQRHAPQQRVSSRPSMDAKPPQFTGQAAQIVARGKLNSQDYLLFSDGTVEVDTVLGRHKFRSLEDARHFIN